MDQHTTTSANEKRFNNRVWTVCFIVTFFVLLIWFFQATISVFLLVLAGALIALYFHGLAGWLQRLTHLSKGYALIISVLITFVLIGGFLWLAGYKIGQQIDQLTNTLPTSASELHQRLKSFPLGTKLEGLLSSKQSRTSFGRLVGTFFHSAFGILGDLYVVLFIGIFFTASPGVYANGFISLLPPSVHPTAQTILKDLGSTLKKWLKGKLFAMLVVAVLTVTGLLIIGVPMAFTLAIIAGILNFIPNFGPLLALVPALLVAMQQGSSTVFYVLALYILVQVAESNFITPQVQKKLIRIPPALIITGQLFMGAITGGWGLLLATPIVAIIMVVLKHTYLKGQKSKDS